MKPREKNRFWLEVNVVDHCNLNCQCCDHFSPIADNYFLDISDFEKDITRLAKIMGNEIRIFKIQGGEPTLHPQLIDFIKIVRKNFPKACILLCTNGILLPSLENNSNGNLWQAIKDYNIVLMVTTYPIKINYKKIDELAQKYEISYKRFIDMGDENQTINGNVNFEVDKTSVRHPFKLKGKVPKYQYISCYQFNESITLRHGKIYTCPLIPYVNYFNKYFNKNLKVSKNCYIDIYKTETYEEIAEFCTRRTDFCNYCNVRGRQCLKWAVSKKNIKEWS